MRYGRVFGAAGLVLALLGTEGSLEAVIIHGCVLVDNDCDGEYDIGLAGVTVQLKDSEGDVIDTTLSDDSGLGVYEFANLEPGSYQICVVLPEGFRLSATTCQAGGGSSCDSGDGENPIKVTLAPSANVVRIKANFIFCYLCWMTGGGVKFEEEVFLATIPTRGKKGVNGNGNGPNDSVGGVVFPSCSPVPGRGGNWNHPSHSTGIHLLGSDIQVVRCGNVMDPNVEPGTESPVCSVNFIEFEGTGRVQALGGADVERRDVCFFGRVEDRNEPGNSNAQDDDNEVDRYFLRVFDCDSGDLILLVDEDGVDDGDVDPLMITGGNFQIHCTSCDGRPNGNGGGGADRQLSSLPEEFREGLRLGTYFLRGDANVDGGVDVSDALFGLKYLFGSGATPRCMDAADANDDGQVNVSDSVALLNGLFSSGPLLAPFPIAGIDETRDDLDCGLLMAE